MAKPSTIRELEEFVRQKQGDFGSKRVQRAADEIPNLERMYTQGALQNAFAGDLPQALMTMNPAEFEKFATPIPRQVERLGKRHTRDREEVAFKDYIKHLGKLEGGFDSVPRLEINKQNILPFHHVAAHEGRHRSRALTKNKVDKSLVGLVPQMIDKPMSQEELLQEMRAKLYGRPLVIPQSTYAGVNRRQLELPDYYAKGGKVKEPKKTVKAYKMFRVDPKRPSQLFPLFVDADTPVPMNQWVDAIEGSMANGKVKSKIGPLAYRPGWHAGDLPLATHIGDKDDEQKAEVARINALRQEMLADLGGDAESKKIVNKMYPYPEWVNAPRLRNPNHIWAEIEMPDDVDWQAEATRRGHNEQGKFSPVRAHITDQLPKGGHYRYKTNANMTGNWLIGGAMKVNKILHDAEVEAINKAAGTADLPRRKPLKHEDFGFAEGGSVAPDEWMAEEYANHNHDPLKAEFRRLAEGGSAMPQDVKAKLDQLKQEFTQLAERDRRAAQATWNAEQMANKKAKGGKISADTRPIKFTQQPSIVPYNVAQNINMQTSLPTSPEFATAVQNTEGSEITPEGLKMSIQRFQKPEQSGDTSVRQGVFYLPKGSANIKHYKKSNTGYGGTEEIKGDTLVRNPLFTKGATGGKAPEAAYDMLMGKGASKQLANDIMKVISERNKGLQEEKIARLLEQHGMDADEAWHILQNSSQGNQLRYALQERIIGHHARKAGHDAILGYSKGRGGKGEFLSELFDLREADYPTKQGGYRLNPEFEKAKGGNVSTDSMRYALTMNKGKKHG